MKQLQQTDNPSLFSTCTNESLRRYNDHHITISWKNLSYGGDDNKILKNLTGCALPCRTLAIIGPSGAGKTVFLSALGARLEQKAGMFLTGNTALNDILYNRSYRKLLGFVPQNDIIQATATPSTAMRFTLRVRRGITRLEAKHISDDLIADLRLTRAKDTHVGSVGIKAGLSSGERKRTNVGIELVVDTKLLILDEPTSGLDSTTAFSLIKTLKDISRQGRTIIFTIQQPTAQILRELDEIMLLAEGSVTYHGLMSNMVSYFNSIGFQCPATYTPTDYIMDILHNSEISNYLVKIWNRYLYLNSVFDAFPIPSFLSSKNHVSHENLLLLKRNMQDNSDDIQSHLTGAHEGGVYLNSPDSQNVFTELGAAKTGIDDILVTGVSDDILKFALPCVPQCTSFIPLATHPTVHNNRTLAYVKEYLRNNQSSLWVQYVELQARAMRALWLDYHISVVICVEFVIFGFVLAVVFRNLTNDVTSIQDRMGLLFTITLNIVMSVSITVVENFDLERKIFIREQQSGAYSPNIYFFAGFIADLSFYSFIILLQVIPIYFICKLHLSFISFLIFLIVLLGCSMISTSLGVLLSIAIKNSVITRFTIPMINLPLMLVSGLVASNEKLQPYWTWLGKISVMRYTFILLCHNEYKSLDTITCDASKFGVDYCTEAPKNGKEVLHFYGFDEKNEQLWCIVGMVLLFATLRGLGLLALHFVAKFQSN